MSSTKRFNESPNHFMVLDAVSRGMKKVDGISKVTKLSKDEVELIVNDLVAQKILIKNVKKGFFGNKKIELDIAVSGIMNMMFFASMMSFMGMAMNPAESAVTEGQVDENTGGAADESGATADSSDSGSSEMDTTSGGDAGFEGFDGGGFGDF